MLRDRDRQTGSQTERRTDRHDEANSRSSSFAYKPKIDNLYDLCDVTLSF
jgi:hypothetical protein